jgi:hypothetical protein
MSPDGSKTVSPEERLLRLIRGKGKPAAVPEAALGAQPLAGPARRAWSRPGRWLGWLNVALITLLALEVAALVAVWLQPPPVLPVARLDARAADPPDATADVLAAIAETPSLAASASRPLFHAETVERTGSAPLVSTGPSEDAKTMAARLSLIGIVAGESPQAIIEDSQTQKTYFVAKGDTVIGELIVSEVLQNRVVLEFRGETIELSL